MTGLAQYPASVTLDANGKGTVRITNNNIAVIWTARQVSVRTIPAQAGCTANLFQNVQLIATSYFAGTGDTAGGDPPAILNPGEYIECQFDKGPPNGQGVIVMYYEENPR